MGAAAKKKRNRKRKNKESKLTMEEINSMPIDDLCNYIENKAQNEAVNNANKLAQALAGQKIKKKGSIDEKDFKIHKQHLTDISQLPYRFMSNGDVHNLNTQKIKARILPNDGGIQMYLDENGVLCGSANCNYCSGKLVTNNGTHYNFIHDEKCLFRQNEYGSDQGEELFDEEYDEEMENDSEADREVEELKKRLERCEMMRFFKRLKPNVTKEWVQGLKEKLKCQESQSAPPHSNEGSGESIEGVKPYSQSAERKVNASSSSEQAR